MKKSSIPGVEDFLEDKMTENFLNLGKEMLNIQVQKAQRVLNKMNPKGATLRQIIRMSKVKERIPLISKRKTNCYIQGTPIRPLGDFSANTLQARRESHDIFKVLKCVDICFHLQMDSFITGSRSTLEICATNLSRYKFTCPRKFFTCYLGNVKKLLDFLF